MNVLFCHDGPIEKDEFGNYYGIGFNDELFKKYEILDSNISIAMRVHDTFNRCLSNNYLKLTKEKFRVIKCPNLASIKGIFLNKQKCIKILEEEIKNADIIIIRLPSNIGNLAAKIAEKNKKKYIIELVGCPWDSLRSHSFIGKFVAPIMFFETKYHVKKAKNVIYVTEKFLQKRYPNSYNNIGCSDVIIENLDNINLDKRIKKIKDMKEKIIIGTIGIIDIKYKGQEYIIKAIKELLDDGIDNIEYQLVGPGNSDRLKKIAEKYNILDRIKFIGPITHDEIFEWLDKIDIYAQPSCTEGLPRSVIEAMSRGCPCIGSKVGGIPELINNEYLFRKKNVKEIVDVLKKMILNKGNVSKEARRNFEYSKRYCNDVLMEKKNKFYEEIRKEKN